MRSQECENPETDDDVGIEQLTERARPELAVGEADQRHHPGQEIALDEKRRGISGADGGDCERLRAERTPAAPNAGQEPQLQHSRNDQEIMFERKAERGARADGDGEEHRYRASLAPGCHQRGIGQGSDQHDLFTLANVHPRHRGKDQRGIGQEQCPPGGRDMAEQAVGCRER